MDTEACQPRPSSRGPGLCRALRRVRARLCDSRASRRLPLAIINLIRSSVRRMVRCQTGTQNNTGLRQRQSECLRRKLAQALSPTPTSSVSYTAAPSRAAWLLREGSTPHSKSGRQSCLPSSLDVSLESGAHDDDDELTTSHMLGEILPVVSELVSSDR